ncbi:hypothetical protein INT48_009739 [Thamnidium elegans]|uniref:CCHC-type domain-containing protein n=1 Tax=Thamnidium elegans TaxID=101142 RepID=A0A8H7SHB8_9FUNG|nr:hypothetical protein INT48_009739 [Thamnidium elegans]
MADSGKKQADTSASHEDMASLVKNLATLMREVNKNKNIKAKEPDYYNGERNAVKIEGWISSVESYTRAQSMDDEEAGIYSIGLLKGMAETWYRTTEKPEEGEPPLGWLTLKRLLKEFFCPENSELLARDRIANLKQIDDLSTYINKFLDCKLAIPNMTDNEACDKFMRGLKDLNTAAYVRQHFDGTLKTATRSALTFDSAYNQQEQFGFFRNPSVVRSVQQPVQAGYARDDPMDLDWIDNRGKRNYRGGNKSNNSRFGNNSSGGGRCFYCNKLGHIKRDCIERRNDIKAQIRKLDEARSNRGERNKQFINVMDSQSENDEDNGNNNNNKNLIQFDPYSTVSIDDSLFPVLQVTKNVENRKTTNVTELIPIIYPSANDDINDEFNHITELNSIATTLPLYSGIVNKSPIKVLIDSGASENYVSPHVLKADQKLIPVYNRKVETAGGEITEIKYKVKLEVNLNGYKSFIMLYVFPTKFDLILGRAWLKTETPNTDWTSDTWYINKGSTQLKPITNTYKNNSSLTSISKLSYLISHKQADRYVKKGAESFLFCIRDASLTADVLSRMNFTSEEVAPESESLEPDMLYAAWDELPPLLRADWPLLLFPEERRKDPRTTADITSRELEGLGQNRAAAEFRMKAMSEKDKRRWDAAIKPLSFETGNLVLLTNEGRYGLEPTFKGPYVVVQSFPDYGTYKLETVAGEPLKSLVHVDRLKAANGEKPTTAWFNPTDTRREWRAFEKETGNQVLKTKVIPPVLVDTDIVDHIDPLEPISAPVIDEPTIIQYTAQDISPTEIKNTSGNETQQLQTETSTTALGNQITIPSPVLTPVTINLESEDESMVTAPTLLQDKTAPMDDLDIGSQSVPSQ